MGRSNPGHVDTIENNWDNVKRQNLPKLLSDVVTAERILQSKIKLTNKVLKYEAFLRQIFLDTHEVCVVDHIETFVIVSRALQLQINIHV